MSTLAQSSTKEAPSVPQKAAQPASRERDQSPVQNDFLAQLSMRNNQEGNKLIKDEKKPISEAKKLSNQENKVPNDPAQKPAGGEPLASKGSAAKLFQQKRQKQNAAIASLITEESKADSHDALNKSVGSQGASPPRRANKALQNIQKWKRKPSDAANTSQEDAKLPSQKLPHPQQKALALANAKTTVVKKRQDSLSKQDGPSQQTGTALVKQSTMTVSLPKIKKSHDNKQLIDMSLETENSAVTPRDIKLLMLEKKDEAEEEEKGDGQDVDKTKKALLDLKDLFDKKIAFKWTGGKRQNYERMQNWTSLTNLHHLVNIETLPNTPDAQACKIVLNVPAIFTFRLTEIPGSLSNSVIKAAGKGQESKVLLRVNATFFDPDTGKFVGRTCTPEGLPLVSPSRHQKELFKLPTDSAIEFYFFARASASYNIIFDLYLERVCSAEKQDSRDQRQIGWLFAPLFCLQSTLKRYDLAQTQNNRYSLLKGSPRMLLDTDKAQFMPISSGYVVTVDSLVLSNTLQNDLQLLKSLIPQDALVSDADAVPGIHHPNRDESVFRRDLDSQVVNAIKKQKTVRLFDKEQRKMNLLRLRVHYICCNEKSILKLIRERFELKTGRTDVSSVKVTQRRLDIKMHNTWLSVGPLRSVNLAAPVTDTNKNRQVLEACANIVIEQVPMDVQICILFEVVIEVRIETSDAVFKEFVTLAIIPYMPHITISRVYPVELGDDYILESVSLKLPRKTPSCSHYPQVLPIKGAEILLEGIVSSRDDIMKQVEIREQERQYQSQLDKMRRNRRRELERKGLEQGSSAVQDDEDVVKVKIEQHLLLEQLDENRTKQVRFLQESEMLKFQTEDASGMNYFDSIRQVQRTAKIELNSLKKRYQQNLKTLKTLEKSGQAEPGTANYEDSDEEAERLAREFLDQKVANFTPKIGFKSRTLAQKEASGLLAELRSLAVGEAMLAEPVDPEQILLHKEAVDTSRINHLNFYVVKVKIDPAQLQTSEIQTALQMVEEFSLSGTDADQVLDLELEFGNFAVKKEPVTVLANQEGLLRKAATYAYDDIQCMLNKDLADYFKMFYLGDLKLSVSLPGGKSFASSSFDIKQSLRQRASVSLVAYEADLVDTVSWNKIGSISLVVKHEGKFVNPGILARVNSQAEKSSTVKKVRVRDPKWLKIKTSEQENEEIVEESKKQAPKTDLERSIKRTADGLKTAATPQTDVERKLQRIAAFKARQNRQTAEGRTMRVQPKDLCTHSRSRSGSRDSSPSSTMSRPMSASLVAAVRERCIMPQIVTMTEEEYIKQKRENFRPALTSQSIVGERHIDLRIGEPSLFYIVLENTNERQPRTFTVTFSSHSEKVQSSVKLISNLNELDYWQTYGKLGRQVTHEGREVRFFNEDNIVESCILQNEFALAGLEAVAVPFVIRSYKPIEFEKERIQVKATYRESRVQQNRLGASQSAEDDQDDIHNEVHRFNVSRRFQPSMLLKSFEPFICKELKHREASIKLLPSFKKFFADNLRPNYIGDISVLVNRLFFKSNWGKIELEDDGESLMFDGVQVPETASMVDLYVHVYNMANMDQVAQSNPYDLVQVLNFKLRLLPNETLLKIKEAQKPPEVVKEPEEEFSELDELTEQEDNPPAASQVPSKEKQDAPGKEESGSLTKVEKQEVDPTSKADSIKLQDGTQRDNQSKGEEIKSVVGKLPPTNEKPVADGKDAQAKASTAQVKEDFDESVDFDEKEVIRPVLGQGKPAIVKVSMEVKGDETANKFVSPQDKKTEVAGGDAKKDATQVKPVAETQPTAEVKQNVAKPTDSKSSELRPSQNTSTKPAESMPVPQANKLQNLPKPMGKKSEEVKLFEKAKPTGVNPLQESKPQQAQKETETCAKVDVKVEVKPVEKPQPTAAGADGKGPDAKNGPTESIKVSTTVTKATDEKAQPQKQEETKTAVKNQSLPQAEEIKSAPKKDPATTTPVQEKKVDGTSPADKTKVDETVLSANTIEPSNPSKPKPKVSIHIGAVGKKEETTAKPMEGEKAAK